MFNVGLDVGDNCSSIEILDEHGKQFKHLEVKGRWPVMLQRIEKEVPKPFAISDMDIPPKPAITLAI